MKMSGPQNLDSGTKGDLGKKTKDRKDVSKYDFAESDTGT